MKIFNCPILGPRPASEFLCAGSALAGMQNDDLHDARHGVYFGDATAKVKREWWFHRASQLWFLISRDTATDSVLEIALASMSGAQHGK